jgi:hypothetical protein
VRAVIPCREVLLEREESPQDRRGIAFEEVRVDHVERSLDVAEFRIDRLGAASGGANSPSPSCCSTIELSWVTAFAAQ